ncbi:DUF721 family protein [Mycobacteroides abscessus]|uniref:DUF721 family protein n=1 Tax=Mycobacteroides abscessus TaxID=36809 RepID=UPI0009A79801|nr:DUF721 family protein [Mycobacteroides abscessus]SLH38392.1 putative RNA-binding protein containing Zn ribbon [Mycobacteroides abscessus subsp. massiliense]
MATSDGEDQAAGQPPPHLAHVAGMDLVRRTLEQARGAARAQGKEVGRGGTPPQRPRTGGSRRWSGPGPDGRDPQLLSSALSDTATVRGWSAHVSEGTVVAQWGSIVGEDIAAHAAASSLRDGVLNVEADSTAWATQLRMIQNQLIARIAERVGPAVVTSLKITGPSGSSWRKGPRHVAGRGPRDTYR